MKLHVRSYCRLVLIVIVILAVVNIVVILKSYSIHSWSTTSWLKASGDVKALRVTEGGELKLNLAGLMLPSGGPSDHFLKDPIVNDHNFSYVHNPRHICANSSLELIVCVVSTASNFDRRRAARRSKMKPPGVKQVFFLGVLPLFIGLQKRVDKEVQQYGDIVQESFMESSRNLSLKSVAILRWVRLHCPTTKFALKKDDDVGLNLFKIMNSLRQKEHDYPYFIMGNSKYLVEGPIRDVLSKYFTSHEEFQDNFFPIFAHGPAYGFTQGTAEILYEVSRRTRLFWLEDVYITGICANRAKIPLFFDKSFVYKHISYDAV